jgi:chromosome segregation ATPase
MRISRLKLSGFKSFVEPAELRIEPGLTGVVGPNGCGKSNLLEAIRWVMGESSAKSMRGGGMEDVIFAGTASRPRAISPKWCWALRMPRASLWRSCAASSAARAAPIA